LPVFFSFAIDGVDEQGMMLTFDLVEAVANGCEKIGVAVRIVPSTLNSMIACDRSSAASFAAVERANSMSVSLDFRSTAPAFGPGAYLSSRLAFFRLIIS
jgi:hypothetical protein